MGAAILTIAAVIGGLLAFLQDGESPQQQALDSVRKGRLLVAKRDWKTAELLARSAIELNKDLATAYQLAAECALVRQDYKQALDDLSSITQEDNDLWRKAQIKTAKIYQFQLHRLSKAEKAYRLVLSAYPDDIEANDGCARLLGLCGRRTEAIPHILKIVRAGQKTDLLMLLSRESGSLNNAELLEAARKSAPHDPNPLLGQATAAASRHENEEALDLLKTAGKLNDLPKDFHSRLGRQLLETQRFEELKAWAKEVSNENTTGETWMVLASCAAHAGDKMGTARCYWEALKLRPESLVATNQMAQILKVTGEQELAAVFSKRVEEINSLRAAQRNAIMSSETPKLAEIMKMIDTYESVGRLWEALGWGIMALDAQPDSQPLQQFTRRLKTKLSNAPLALTLHDDNPASQVDLSHFPLPNFDKLADEDRTKITSSDISFRRQGTDVGFDFRYFDGSVETTRRMDEFSGGGVAVIDFDNDNRPDLFCSQGRASREHESSQEQHFDQLFRNTSQQTFRECAAEASVLMTTEFGQGVAAGDVNNDGFVDLYTASTGTNALWINNGDGTFSLDAGFASKQQKDWTTSCLIADINGDSIPDLYDVNYLAGHDLFTRTCTDENNEPVLCALYDFPAAMDCLWIGNGGGDYTESSQSLMSPPPAGKGLGIVAIKSESSGLSLFVANDTTANFFYTPSTEENKFTDIAITAGLAFNADGKAEACMGVAVGDCTQDGQLDLFITNFLYESNTFYTPIGPRLFEDKTRMFGLHDVSLPVLGFGTQFLDANLDGQMELYVANGHTQDLSRSGTPYAMKPQLFEWTQNGFQQLPESQLGDWSSHKAVGRSVATLDWNRDGYKDLVVGRLDAPYDLLTNTSGMPNVHGVAIRLVATQSARDAIGTIVTAVIGEESRVYQLTAGDGYQCSNERLIQIGCGPERQIDRLTVEWPSGQTQSLSDVEVDGQITWVEDQGAFPCPEGENVLQ